MKLTNQNILVACGSACGPTMMERGRKYQAAGKVFNLEWNEKSRVLTGSVEGSYDNAYWVEIEFSDTRKSLLVDGECSCPVGYNCKHVVALTLQWISTRAGAPKKDNALARWQKALIDYHPALENTPARDPAHAYLYLLSTVTYGDHQEVSVEVVKARRLKKGGYGKSTRISTFDVNSDVVIRHQEGIDIRLGQLINAARKVHYHSQFPLTGDTGALALTYLLQTGRCHVVDQDGPILQAGREKTLTLNWQSIDNKKRLLATIEGLSSEWICAAMEPPRYIDPDSGECGAISTTLNGQLLNRLRYLPALTSRDATTISRSLLGDRYLEALPPPVALNITKIEGTPGGEVLMSVTGEESGGIRCLQLSVNYGGFSVAHMLNDHRSQLLLNHQGDEVLVHRDRQAEKELLDNLLGLGFSLFGDDQHQVLIPAIENTGDSNDFEVWQRFMEKDSVALQAKGWKVKTDDRFNLRFVSPSRWHLTAEDDDDGWIGVSMQVEIDGEEHPLLPMLGAWLEQNQGRLRQALESTQDIWLDDEDGRVMRAPVVLIKPVVETLIELFEQQGSREIVRMHSLHGASLELLKNAFSAGGATVGRWQLPESLGHIADNISRFHDGELAVAPVGLGTTLRAYQQHGVEWLQFLRQCHFGGILADDMGLGKTVQVLAHLLFEKQQGRLDKPSLVVVPTSLIGNWRREVIRFASELSVFVLHGMDRKQQYGRIADHDIVITTYSLLSRDSEILLEQEFVYAILDEAQKIKNPTTKAAKTASRLNADFRLCMTGTPVENNLTELWSQFNFAMPGLLGDLDSFTKRYRIPIEKQGDQLLANALRSRLSTFILRRTKQQVAADLPDKVLMTSAVEFDQKQALLYESVRATMEKRVRDVLSQSGAGNSHITVLDALLKLRQVCCDPRLVKLEQASRVRQSAKLELLMEMLPELIADGRRILVFSQFTSMLALIEEEFLKNDIAHVKLTGQTRDRDSVVDAFQTGEIPVFLISLKAGGVGLNLTAADTVILYDPWWNPAVENQAIDRAHRIGQKKAVFVYRLIVENTIEEKNAQTAGGKAETG